MRKEGTWRYHGIGAIFVLFSTLIIFQVFRIQHSPEATAFIAQGDLYATQRKIVFPGRGRIYDRYGRLLAGNQTVYEVGVDLKRVKNPETIAFTLMVMLGSDYGEVLTASKGMSSQSVYAILQDYVSADKVQELIKLMKDMDAVAPDSDQNPPASLQGLIFTPHLQRSYPEDDLASNILGFVSREGKGYFGIEEKFGDLLSGTAVEIQLPTDPNMVEEIPEIPEGTDIILTIDREIQAHIESVLDKSLIESGAEAGMIIVMDPKNGEILGMASTPRINLNEYWKYKDTFQGTTPYNRAISKGYEPGSVFKVLTMSSALDSGAVKPDTIFLDVGSIEVGGVLIHNWDRASWGPQDMLGCLQHSLNVCLAWVATQVGVGTLYQYLEAFGLGRLTGIDLAGEAAGRLKIPGDADWYEADLGTNSFGQGVEVTPIQMIAAVSALANDGKMVSPHVMYAMVDKGRQFQITPQISGVPITVNTSRTITEMLASSLEREASSALVPGYRLAGKTGTAEIPTPMGYTSNLTNASFVGWGPTDDPKFIVYIWLEKPTISPWGSVVAAPVFKEVVERLVVLMNLPPDDIRHQLAGN